MRTSSLTVHAAGTAEAAVRGDRDRGAGREAQIGKVTVSESRCPWTAGRIAAGSDVQPTQCAQFTQRRALRHHGETRELCSFGLS